MSALRAVPGPAGGAVLPEPLAAPVAALQALDDALAAQLEQSLALAARLAGQAVDVAVRLQGQADGLGSGTPLAEALGSEAQALLEVGQLHDILRQQVERVMAVQARRGLLLRDLLASASGQCGAAALAQRAQELLQAHLQAEACHQDPTRDGGVEFF